MSRSCDLFSKGPQKHHPHALWLDELMKRFRRLILVLGLIFGFGVWQPIWPLSSLFTTTVGYHTWTGASSFYHGYKTRWRISGSPTCSFVIAALRFYFTRALCC
jgi:hypothetical protein